MLDETARCRWDQQAAGFCWANWQTVCLLSHLETIECSKLLESPSSSKLDVSVALYDMTTIRAEGLTTVAGDMRKFGMTEVVGVNYLGRRVA